MTGRRSLAALCALVWPAASLADVPAVLSRGWVEVQVPAALAQSGDEILGALIEGGAAAEEILWLKPLYGDQNMALASVPRSLAESRMKRMQKNNPPLPGPDGCSWTGAQTAEQSAFGLMLFTAPLDAQTSRLAIFWGSNGAGHAADMQALLKTDAAACGN